MSSKILLLSSASALALVLLGPGCAPPQDSDPQDPGRIQDGPLPETPPAEGTPDPNPGLPGGQQGPSADAGSSADAGTALLWQDTFSVPDGLITNEYAYWNPGSSSAVQSPDWEMTSGSLFAKNGAGWSGVPDGTSPDPLSAHYTDSAVFRLNTKRYDYGNVAVSFKLLNSRLVTTSRTPATDWDGIHVFLRYQDQTWLYYASINRRDNTAVIKKKVSGGSTNGGTYYQLTPNVKYTVPYGAWQRVKATVVNNTDGSVTIQLFANDTLLVSTTDRGTGGPPITHAGAVGIRGDNSDFQFDDFTVAPL